MVKATWNGETIAESDQTVIVEGNHYFPRTSVDEQYLDPSDTSSVCPWKGRAQYLSLVVNGERNENAAWYYPDPSPKAAAIKDHLAFWRGVQVS